MEKIPKLIFRSKTQIWRLWWINHASGRISIPKNSTDRPCYLYLGKDESWQWHLYYPSIPLKAETKVTLDPFNFSKLDTFSLFFWSCQQGSIILLYESSESQITLRLESDVSSQAVRCCVSGSNSCDGVNIGDIDLDRWVILSPDQSVSPRAFSWNV